MSYFVTGTDTGCGKTFVTATLLRGHAALGERVIGMKPVASGAELVDGHWRNDDVETLAAAANVPIGAADINTYCFALPASPHLAAAAAGATVTLDPILEAWRSCAGRADRVLVEGVGGWCVPLAPGLWVADLVRGLALPTVLVVGVRLGCINHALLTAREMARAGHAPVAWIANLIEQHLADPDGVLATLEQNLPAPLAGILPQGTPDPAIARHLAARLRDLLPRNPSTAMDA